MSPIQFVKTLAVMAAVGYAAFAETLVDARSLEDSRLAMDQIARQQQQNDQVASPYMYPMNPKQASLEQTDDNEDSGDDNDGAEMSSLQGLPAQMLQSGSALYQNERQPIMGYNEQDSNVERLSPTFNVAQQLKQQQQQQQLAQPSQQTDLKTSASHHHHGHKGAKGWLDMGAWTGKKGAFGWYDKHPVGKGK